MLYSRQLVVLQHTKLRSLLSLSSAFDSCKYDSNRAISDVDYQAWNENFLRSSDFDVLRRAGTKKISRLVNKRVFSLASKISKLALSARLPKNIETSTFEKAFKSSHFRSDNQRQISLDLSHTCRNQKRFISLINPATLYVVRRQACCEYSEQICAVLLTYLLYHVLKQGVPVSEGCVHVSKGVSPYPHPKNILICSWAFKYSYEWS
jgi:hypothetical protein